MGTNTFVNNCLLAEEPTSNTETFAAKELNTSREKQTNNKNQKQKNKYCNHIWKKLLCDGSLLTI